MDRKTPDERLSEWAELRKELPTLEDPLTSVIEFWSDFRRIIHNHNVNPHNPADWPTPWEIIYENKYDDFTIALMMAYTLKLSESFKNSKVEVRTMVDSSQTRLYNLVYVNENEVLNYEAGRAVLAHELDSSLYLENLIEVVFPR
jgi:hypothetical protein